MDRLDHDSAYKAIYGHPFMVQELVRWLVPNLPGGRELVDSLDFDTLERAAEQSVVKGRRRSTDMVWRLRFRPGNGRPSAWLHLVLLLEFQSQVDFLMALRIRQYVDNFHMESWRGKRFKSTDRLPPVLGLVIYNGALPWTARLRVADLVLPESSHEAVAAAVDVETAWWTNGLFAGEGYVVVDSQHTGGDDYGQDNAAALLAAIESPAPGTIADQVAALQRRLSTQDLRPLRDLLLDWSRLVVERQLGLDLEMGNMANADRLHVPDDLGALYDARRKYWQDFYRAEGREEVREKAREEARALLLRQASRRFGADAGAPLAVFLKSVDDSVKLAEVGDWIVDCATAAELIERLEAVG